MDIWTAGSTSAASGACSSSWARLLLAGGVLLVLLGQIPFFGRLPGDIAIQRERFSFFFPLATMLIVSLVLTILINLALRLFR